jgi:hypothetical protein
VAPFRLLSEFHSYQEVLHSQRCRDYLALIFGRHDLRRRRRRRHTNVPRRGTLPVVFPTSDDDPAAQPKEEHMRAETAGRPVDQGCCDLPLNGYDQAAPRYDPRIRAGGWQYLGSLGAGTLSQSSPKNCGYLVSELSSHDLPASLIRTTDPRPSDRFSVLIHAVMVLQISERDVRR